MLEIMIKLASSLRPDGVFYETPQRRYIAKRIYRGWSVDYSNLARDARIAVEKENEYQSSFRK